MKVRIALLSLLCCLLSACSSLPWSVLPTQTPVVQTVRWQVKGTEPSLVLIAPFQSGIRFLWSDVLGVPIARQSLQENRWHEDGLLPPNAMARPLFTALLLLQLSDEERRWVYPQVSQRDGQWFVQKRLLFRSICDDKQHCELIFSDNHRYQVMRLP